MYKALYEFISNNVVIVIITAVYIYLFYYMVKMIRFLHINGIITYEKMWIDLLVHLRSTRFVSFLFFPLIFAVVANYLNKNELWDQYWMHVFLVTFLYYKFLFYKYFNSYTKLITEDKDPFSEDL